MSIEFEKKAPGEGVLPDFIPQELITGDILRGYGPRRGNLERLLRYWRPIMRKPGGFRRCRVILANHPELYPLERICAWLHHETTGLWPNEGCHHPGMKNCKGKLRKRNWGNAQFNARLRKLRGGKKKDAFGEEMFFSDFYEYKSDEMQNYVVTEADFKHAISVLLDFVELEPVFVKELRDVSNWEIEAELDNGEFKILPFDYEMIEDCCDEK